MTCPHLKEVVMLYCDACHVKKMVPLHQLVSASPCLAQDYRSCTLYKDLVERLRAATEVEEPPTTRVAAGSGKEVHT